MRKSLRVAEGQGTNSSAVQPIGRGSTGSVSALAGGRPLSASQHHDAQSFADESTMSLHAKIAQLEKDLERRQESYITRERAYKVRIDELEEELSAQRESKTGWMKNDSRMGNLKGMHTQILNNVELVQDRTARILQEQERDLLRAFRARLFDVQAELEKEKNKKDDGAAAWIERSRQLEAEVEWAKEVADRLERVNQTLLQENNRLKGQFTSQEEDRNFLIKQLVAVKKDNARLRAEYVELEKENERLKQLVDGLNDKINNQPAQVVSTKNATNTTTANAIIQQKLESEEKFKELNVRLRRLLAEERKSLSQVRQSYANELKIRTDMEMLLRQCVEDVRKEIARRYVIEQCLLAVPSPLLIVCTVSFFEIHRYIEDGQFGNNSGNDLAKLYSKQPGLIPVDDFTQADRERVLELLLSQERVVSLIYAKTFPINPSITHKGSNIDNNAPNAGAGGANPAGAGNAGNEFNQLFDGGDYAMSPGNPNAGSNNDSGRPSTTSALQAAAGLGNPGGNNMGHGLLSATTSPVATSKGGLTLPPVNQNRGISR